MICLEYLPMIILVIESDWLKGAVSLPIMADQTVVRAAR